VDRGLKPISGLGTSQKRVRVFEFVYVLSDLMGESPWEPARNEAYGPARVTKLGKQVGRLKRGTGASAVPRQA
jgi:hypothetical protein